MKRTSAGYVGTLVAAVRQIVGEVFTYERLARTSSPSRTDALEEADRHAPSMYYDGEGVPQDYAEAAAWCRRAADQGDARAQYFLGSMYYDGQGVLQNYAMAATWYRQAAKQGNALAQGSLGRMYYYGRGVPQDYAEAATWFRQAAEQGDAHAQYFLGSMYYDGQGVPQDYAEAITWCRRAADQDNTDAQDLLGDMCYHGEGVPQDYAEAATWYRQAAEQNNVYAQTSLGRMYYYGEGVPQDYAEAAAWCRRAADQGNAPAQDLLGHMYYYGKGVPQNYAKAVVWCRRAADQGNASAQDLLGHMYYYGKGVPQNYAKAVVWCRRAADQDDADELRDWAEQQMAADGLASVAELIKRIEGSPPEKIGKRQLNGAADALARLSIGMAPDPRFDLRSAKLREPVMLFPLPAGITRPEEVSAHYPPALLSLVIGAFVAHADGAVSDLERRHLIERFRSSSVLTDSEKARLQANLDWMMAVPPGLAPIHRLVKDVGDEVRHGLGRLALAVAAADGVVGPAEVKAIQKLYRILGIEADDVYRDLHALAATEPVTVFRPTTAEPEFAAPAPQTADPAADSAPVVLDQERVEAEAATWYRRAADQGDDLAPDLLDDMYYYGDDSGAPAVLNGPGPNTPPEDHGTTDDQTPTEDAKSPTPPDQTERSVSSPASPANKEAPATAPRVIGGRRNQQHRSSSSRKTANGDSPTFSPRPELICREAEGSQLWEVLLSAESDIATVCHRTRPLTSEDGEWLLPSLWGWLSLTLNSGEQLRLSLFEQATPLIFKLGSNWTGIGRKVGAIGSGHYIIITPNTWRRNGQSPVDPQGCVAADFTAHYFFAHGTEQTERELGGFAECKVTLASACINLDGDRIFDDAEQGPLFVGAVPQLRAADSVVWARVGEEREGGWKGENFRLNERSLSEVLQRREGRFFLRVYDAASKLLDSVEFRYCADLRQIMVNGEPYSADTLLVPRASGHRPTTVQFLGSDGTTLAPTLPNTTKHAIVREGVVVVDPHPDGDDLYCILKSDESRVETVIKLPRIWWRTAGGDGAHDEWHDTPIAMTRQGFLEHAKCDMEIRMRLPENVSSVNVGFDDEQDRLYHTVIPLQDFVDYTQIDQRLHRDATLIARCGNEALPLVRVSADPLPEVVSFTCEPATIIAGQSAALRWATRNAESGHVAIEPEVGPVEKSGTIVVRPGSNRSYTLKLTTNDVTDLPTTATVSISVLRHGKSISNVQELSRYRSVLPTGNRAWSVLIVRGNRAGHVGYGIGTGIKLSDARRQSRDIARTSVVSVPRCGSTIPCPVDGMFRDTYVSLEPAPSGTGIIAVWAVRTVMWLAGVKDLTCRLEGSREVLSVVRSVFDALNKLSTHQDRQDDCERAGTRAERAGFAKSISPE